MERDIQAETLRFTDAEQRSLNCPEVVAATPTEILHLVFSASERIERNIDRVKELRTSGVSSQHKNDARVLEASNMNLDRLRKQLENIGHQLDPVLFPEEPK